MIFLCTDAMTPQPEDIRRAFMNNITLVECDPGDGNVCALVTFYFGNDGKEKRDNDDKPS